jgi:hypothetical protein|nr:hypothetical protein [Candidatus Krumholzibacteria bacterium]
MEIGDHYRNRLWDIYARAVSLVSVVSITIAVVVGGFDVVRIISPSTTLNSALHEKYQSNDSYTEYGTFKKTLTPEQITHERTLNYEKLLRIERRNGRQRLAKVGLGILAVVAMNGILISLGSGKAK